MVWLCQEAAVRCGGLQAQQRMLCCAELCCALVLCGGPMCSSACRALGRVALRVPAASWCAMRWGGWC